MKEHDIAMAIIAGTLVNLMMVCFIIFLFIKAYKLKRENTNLKAKISLDKDYIAEMQKDVAAYRERLYGKSDSKEDKP